MSDDVTIMRPEHVQQASTAYSAMNSHFAQADKLSAMSRHPATPSDRKREFSDQAQKHNEAAYQAGNHVMSMTSNAQTFSRRGSFQSSAFAHYN